MNHKKSNYKSTQHYSYSTILTNFITLNIKLMFCDVF